MPVKDRDAEGIEASGGRGVRVFHRPAERQISARLYGVGAYLLNLGDLLP
jgi:hypothetical protein